MGNKIWLNSKYIKTKRNQKFEAKFFRLFRILYPVGKQAYKIQLLKKWEIHDISHMSLLKQTITRKEQVKIAIKLDKDDSKEYKVEAICDSEIYAKEIDNSHHLSSFYYLVL